MIIPVQRSYLVVRNSRAVCGTIHATVKMRDPVSQTLMPKLARVDALEDHSGRLVGSAWSDAATGTYTIHGLDERLPHTVLARDPAQAMRPVAADRIVPEASKP